MDALGILQIARLITEDPDVFREDVTQHPQFYNWIETLKQTPEYLENIVYHLQTQLSNADTLEFLKIAYDFVGQENQNLANKIIYYMKQARNENLRLAQKDKKTTEFPGYDASPERKRAHSARIRKQEVQRRSTARLSAIKP